MKPRYGLRLFGVLFAVGLACSHPQPTDETETCGELAKDAKQEVNAAIADAGVSCTQASDCVMSDVPNCGVGCVTPIAAAHADVVRAAVKQVNDTVCIQFSQQNCAKTPICALPAGHIDCVNLQCEYLLNDP